MAKTTTMITMEMAHTVGFGRSPENRAHKDTRGERPGCPRKHKNFGYSHCTREALHIHVPSTKK